MKKKMTIWLLALLLLLSGCGAAEGTEPALPDSPDGIVSEEVVQQPQTDITDSEENGLDVDEETEQSSSEPSNSLPEQTPAPEATNPIENSTFEVHFIDVGQGDCSLILCDGKAMLVDGGEASESSKVYAYLKKLGVNHLDYIVATHAHSDHIGGLSGALNYASVDTALCPVTSYDSKTFSSFTKYLGQQGVSITVPEPGDTFSLGSASVTILGPQKSYEDTNDTSIVMKVVYLETAETAAMGRVLAAAGYGTQFCGAADMFGDVVVDAPLDLGAVEEDCSEETGVASQVKHETKLPGIAQTATAVSMPVPAPATAATPATAPKKQEPVTLEDYLNSMTLEEAKNVRIDVGYYKGNTLGELALRKPSDLEWYVKNYSGRNLALKAGAILLVDAASKMAS